MSVRSEVKAMLDEILDDMLIESSASPENVLDVFRDILTEYLEKLDERIEATTEIVTYYDSAYR